MIKALKNYNAGFPVVVVILLKFIVPLVVLALHIVGPIVGAMVLYTLLPGICIFALDRLKLANFWNLIIFIVTTMVVVETWRTVYDFTVSVLSTIGDISWRTFTLLFSGSGFAGIKQFLFSAFIISLCWLAGVGIIKLYGVFFKDRS